jgi:hypothetical protein
LPIAGWIPKFKSLALSVKIEDAAEFREALNDLQTLNIGTVNAGSLNKAYISDLRLTDPLYKLIFDDCDTT